MWDSLLGWPHTQGHPYAPQTHEAGTTTFLTKMRTQARRGDVVCLVPSQVRDTVWI